MTAVAELVAKPGQQDALLAALQALVAPTTAEQGELTERWDLFVGDVV